MLNVAQKAMLIAFGQVIADIDPVIKVTSYFFLGAETFKVKVVPGYFGAGDSNDPWFAFIGTGHTIEDAFNEVCRHFEEHPMGCKRESVQAWIDAGCPVEELAPDTEREPLLMDAFFLPEESDIDVPPVVTAPMRQYAFEDKSREISNRWNKQVHNRIERRKVSEKLRNG